MHSRRSPLAVSSLSRIKISGLALDGAQKNS